MKTLILTISLLWAAGAAAQDKFDTICTAKGTYYVGKRMSETADSLLLMQTNEQPKAIARKDITACSASQMTMIREQLAALHKIKLSDSQVEQLERNIDSLTSLAIEYSLIDSVPDATHLQLTQRAYEWLGMMGSGGSPLVYTEGERSFILAQKTIKYTPVLPLIKGPLPTDGYISYVVSLVMKNGKYKLALTRFTHNATGLSHGKSIDPYWSIGPITKMVHRDRNDLMYDIFVFRHSEIVNLIQKEMTQLMKLVKVKMQEPSEIEVEFEKMKDW